MLKEVSRMTISKGVKYRRRNMLFEEFGLLLKEMRSYLVALDREVIWLNLNFI